MPSSSGTSSLLITLSRGKVGLDFIDGQSQHPLNWKGNFPVPGIYLHEEISAALDEALLEHPALIEPLEDVVILMLDSPHLMLADDLIPPDDVNSMVSKYLRHRSGEIMNTDVHEGRFINAYPVPAQTLSSLREYYAGADALHLSSVIWTAILKQIPPADAAINRMHILPYEHAVMIIGSRGSDLTFCKTFHARLQADVDYYTLACSGLLKPDETWLLNVAEEEIHFTPSNETMAGRQQRFELSSLRQLIALHLSCEL